MQLKGHGGAIYSCAFDPTGALLASGSMDKSILLWDVFGEDGCTNYNVLAGHKGAILEVKWLPSTASSPTLVSCSSDKVVSLWDADKGIRLRKMEDHDAIVNCCNVDELNPHCVVSGSDDCTAILWDTRSKETMSLFMTIRSLVWPWQRMQKLYIQEGSIILSGSGIFARGSQSTQL